jgi:hypothetical protein
MRTPNQVHSNDMGGSEFFSVVMYFLQAYEANCLLQPLARMSVLNDYQRAMLSE